MKDKKVLSRATFISFFACFFVSLVGVGQSFAQQGGAVVVNGKTVDQQALTKMGTAIPPGRYWYDKKSGAWGQEGGSTQGFIQPGLPLPGPMRRDASNGNTGVIINGREATQQDVQGLSQHFGRQIPPGRYSTDASGQLQPEGGGPKAKAFTAPNRAAPAAPQATPVSVNRNKKGYHHLPGWNISCKLPKDWHAQGEKDRTYTLTNTAGTGRILVHRSFAGKMSVVEKGLVAVVQGLGIRVTDPKPLTIKKRGGKTYGHGTYNAVDGYGRKYKLQTNVILSPYGTALVALGGSTAESFKPVQKAVQEIIGTAELGAPQYNTQRLVGTFYSYSGKSSGGTREGGSYYSSETFYTFDGRGNFRTNTNSHVSAYSGSHNSIGNENATTSSTMLNSSTPRKQATYKLLGEDLLIMVYPNGNTTYNTVQIFSNGLKLNGTTLIKK